MSSSSKNIVFVCPFIGNYYLNQFFNGTYPGGDSINLKTIGIYSALRAVIDTTILLLIKDIKIKILFFADILVGLLLIADEVLKLRQLAYSFLYSNMNFENSGKISDASGATIKKNNEANIINKNISINHAENPFIKNSLGLALI